MLANTCLKVKPSGSLENNAFVNPFQDTDDSDVASRPARAPFFTHNRGGASAPVPLPYHGGPVHQRPNPSGRDDDGDGAGYQNRLCVDCLERHINYNNNNYNPR
eukprot:2595569-Rhodomonas_salina.1